LTISRPLQGDFSRADFSLLEPAEQAVYHFNREFERLICGNVFHAQWAPTQRQPLTQPFPSQLFISAMA